MLSKKLLGLSFVFFVTMHLTSDPDLTNFLNISNETSSLEKISVISFIINGFLKSGLSLPKFSNALEYEILGNFFDINGRNLTQNLTFYRIGIHSNKISNTNSFDEVLYSIGLFSVVMFRLFPSFTKILLNLNKW